MHVLRVARENLEQDLRLVMVDVTCAEEERHGPAVLLDVGDQVER